MTRKFNKVYRGIIHETLVGSKKRNKRPGIGRKGGPSKNIEHVRPHARIMQKHSAHIRPTHKVTGNETGKHTKDPEAKPVYATKNGIRPTTNKSQRPMQSKRNLPYSSGHSAAGTKLNLKDRREKLLKGMNETQEYEDLDIEQRRSSMREDPVENGYYTIYRAVKAGVTSFKPMDYVTRSEKWAIGHADHMNATEEEPYVVIRTLIIKDDESDDVLFHAPNSGEYLYDGPEKTGKEIYKSDNY